MQYPGSESAWALPSRSSAQWTEQIMGATHRRGTSNFTISPRHTKIKVPRTTFFTFQEPFQRAGRAILSDLAKDSRKILLSHQCMSLHSSIHAILPCRNLIHSFIDTSCRQRASFIYPIKPKRYIVPERLLVIELPSPTWCSSDVPRRCCFSCLLLLW